MHARTAPCNEDLRRRDRARDVLSSPRSALAVHAIWNFQPGISAASWVPGASNIGRCELVMGKPSASELARGTRGRWTVDKRVGHNIEDSHAAAALAADGDVDGENAGEEADPSRRGEVWR